MMYLHSFSYRSRTTCLLPVGSILVGHAGLGILGAWGQHNRSWLLNSLMHAYKDTDATEA